MQQLLKSIQPYIDLTPTEEQLLSNAITIRTLTKNELLLSEGKISDEIYFVTQGCIRLFYNVNGNEKTAFFYTENQFICAGESYTFNIPARENYQAIEPTEVIIFKKNKTDLLLQQLPKFEIIARVATENELITCQKIIASFVTQSPEERYRALSEQQGALFQRVPQQYIASFLGVSPETLSRIKARIFKK
ncbi:MAG: Crp/Fnr family transcriptional regulator [Flavobacteriales bacterium]|jgi:CRP-like cAMP-binding protein|nr:Crp/Fnr family transcriptional regulator [Flavobacteriales bacterium]